MHASHFLAGGDRDLDLEELQSDSEELAGRGASRLLDRPLFLSLGKVRGPGERDSERLRWDRPVHSGLGLSGRAGEASGVSRAEQLRAGSAGGGGAFFSGASGGPVAGAGVVVWGGAGGPVVAAWSCVTALMVMLGCCLTFQRWPWSPGGAVLLGRQ